MRIWFDTEFIEDGNTIELLSIGMVREDGATYYVEPYMAQEVEDQAFGWVKENVLPYLFGGDTRRALPEIKYEVSDFVGPDPEFWAWYADYDWVVLCQLYGTMMDLPDTWPMFCRDFRQVARSEDLVPHSVKIDGSEHNALSDAKWLARAMRQWEFDHGRA